MTVLEGGTQAGQKSQRGKGQKRVVKYFLRGLFQEIGGRESELSYTSGNRSVEGLENVSWWI